MDVALLEAVTEDRGVSVHLLVWAGAAPHRKVPSVRELGDPEAWEDPEMLSSSAGLAISYGRHQLFHVLRVETRPISRITFRTRSPPRRSPPSSSRSADPRVSHENSIVNDGPLGFAECLVRRDKPAERRG